MGGSGGGGGGYYPRPSELRELEDSARATEFQQRLDSDVNRMLQDKLAAFNNRDQRKINQYLDDLEKTLSSEGAQIDRLLLGGSVAKQTYVDGLSDVDALVVLDREDLRGSGPQTVLDSFHQSLLSGYSRANVESISKGKLAVTVKYRDGMEIQLLPAVKLKKLVAIPDSHSRGWNRTDPLEFQKRITAGNQRLGGQLVPAIKVLKAINAGLPEQQRLTGYHIEALALKVTKSYEGPRTLKSMVPAMIEAASRTVLRPIPDATGQSGHVDEYLGKPQSLERRVRADALASVARRLYAASSVDQWERMIGE